jgi:iron complex transport system ATP-binding protein
MNASALLLRARDVAVRLGRARVVEAVSFDLAAGELVALVGPNGAGKTTLIRALAGLLPADGEVALAGRALRALSPRERARTVAYLPQGHAFHWPMRVDALVALGRTPHGDPFSPPTAADRAAVARALAVTDSAAFAARTVTTLSEGERARVALARALASEAPVLLTDEPTAALDPRHQLLVMALLRRTARDGAGVLAVIHDLTLAARFADRVLIMQDGRLVADAPPAAALTPARLAETFGIEAVTLQTDAGPMPLAQRPI